MWLVELMLLSLVGGTILGIGLRVWDEAMEKWRAQRVEEAGQTAEIKTTANKTE